MKNDPRETVSTVETDNFFVIMDLLYSYVLHTG